MRYLFLILFLFGCKQIVLSEKTGGEYVWEPFCVLTGTICGAEEVELLWKDRYPVLNIKNEMTTIKSFNCVAGEAVWVKFCKAYKFPEGKVVGEVTQERINIGEQYITTTAESFLQLVVYFIREGVIELKSSLNRADDEDRQ